MPPTTGKAQALQDIDTEVESIAYAYVLASSSEEDDYEEDIEDLHFMQEVTISDRYLLSRDSAGQHNVNILETYIQDYPDSANLTLFCMHRASIILATFKYWPMLVEGLIGCRAR
ncbi:hypothetical protein L211DRAFT_896025 [Terfezia boudieri ATCC MYA-4762]|uniref:Uncharacterized protein n=1 Tax=Terfezia boudieri ATCC MYA-4762 TaxID=1051890 RepID=A0A3N4LE67_9PEZI|nr:hypothetical protein L211DRAFT_896025 [Terfezia boudieri ATCC MYA-4762]